MSRHGTQFVLLEQGNTPLTWGFCSYDERYAASLAGFEQRRWHHHMANDALA